MCTLISARFKSITIHAMAAAIPHALLLLHALLDILPFSQRALWYEIRTGSTECTDEVEGETKIGAVEEDAPTLEKRVKVSTLPLNAILESRTMLIDCSRPSRSTYMSVLDPDLPPQTRGRSRNVDLGNALDKLYGQRLEGI